MNESRQLLASTLKAPQPDAVVSRIVQAAEGNPFAVTEFARCAAADYKRPLPASTAEAITERLCDIPTDALVLLRWLALVLVFVVRNRDFHPTFPS